MRIAFKTLCLFFVCFFKFCFVMSMRLFFHCLLLFSNSILMKAICLKNGARQNVNINLFSTSSWKNSSYLPVDGICSGGGEVHRKLLKKNDHSSGGSFLKKNCFKFPMTGDWKEQKKVGHFADELVAKFVDCGRPRCVPELLWKPFHLEIDWLET